MSRNAGQAERSSSSCRSWVATTIAAGAPTSPAVRSSTSGADKWLVGSSRISRFGRPANRRARSSRRCWPWDIRSTGGAGSPRRADSSRPAAAGPARRGVLRLVVAHPALPVPGAPPLPAGIAAGVHPGSPVLAGVQVEELLGHVAEQGPVVGDHRQSARVPAQPRGQERQAVGVERGGVGRVRAVDSPGHRGRGSRIVLPRPLSPTMTSRERQEYMAQ